MVKKWICCMVLLGFVFCLQSMVFAEAKGDCKLMQIVEANFENAEELIACENLCCNEQKNEACNLKKLKKLKVKVIHWYNVSQKLMAKIQIPSMRESRLLKMIMEYFAAARVSVAL